jgi:hypothetical protein
VNIQRLFGRAASSGATDGATGRATGGDYIEPGSGLVFPVDLGGLRRHTVGRPYAEGDRTGESIAYGGNQAEATVYVTNVGQAEFPDGGESEFIRGELESAMAAVREMERRGLYRSVKYFTGDPERLGDGPGNPVWAKAAFFASTDGRPMVSFVYITALASKVIKIRISASDPENKALKEFPHAMGDLISRQRATLKPQNG